MGLLQSKYKVNEAVSVISSSYKSKHIEGIVLFTQKEDCVHIKVDIKGLTKNHLHGFHIHESGDLREGCKSCCAHYNPENTDHGDLYGGHAGDLGNIKTDENGNCKMSLKADKFSVDDILGRSIIIHEDEDDLGLGTFEDSKTTGHSGARIVCALIGISKDCK
jgi:Cu-Zn family superoxide dismutase